MAENIEDNPPILFGEGPEKNDYARKQEETTKKLLEATDSRNTYEFLVKLIYGEDHSMPVRLLDTQAEAYGQRVPELIEAVRLVRSYNNFRGTEVADALKDLHERGCISHLKFGREGSPVAYVGVPHWTNQASNYDGKDTRRQYNDNERKEMYSAIEQGLRPTDPDEYDIDQFGDVRAWWD